MKPRYYLQSADGRWATFNMVMHEAFMRFDVNMSENSTEESTSFWGAVWDLAMRNQFDPEMIRASK